MENLNYLVGAYMIFWIATAAYLLTIDRRQKEIRRILEKLDRQKI